MLPEGVVYHASWVDPENARCYQLMEAPALDAIQLWTNAWADLVEFEIVPVLTSQEYGAKKESESAKPSILNSVVGQDSFHFGLSKGN